MSFALEAPVSLLPVLVFLLALIAIDSYKLVRLELLAATIIAGAAMAGVAYFANTEILKLFHGNFAVYSRYGSPLVEEILKAAVLVFLLKTQRIGFLVDAAILGFAAGAGFALVENVFYLKNAPDANFLVWIIRGFGTAIMHGGTTAVFASLTKSLCDRFEKDPWVVGLPGFLGAFALHSAYNHFFLPPLIGTAVILIVLPLVAVNVFLYSQKITRDWLDAGFDSDVDLLKTITLGQISTTKVGMYLLSLRSRFEGEALADMLCLVRLHLELSISAKGILLMKEEGYPVKLPPDVADKFEELKYLEKSLGKTGMLAVSPILHRSSRDLWELHMLDKR